MKKSDQTLFILTGGTIDAEPYIVTPKDVIPLKESIIPATLAGIKSIENYSILKFRNVDSKELVNKDLKDLAMLIRTMDFEKVVILMGTDRIPEIARYLSDQKQIIGNDVTVVFTGAMTPIMNQIKGYGPSDGYSNLEFAYQQAQILPYGVHIAFHEKVYDPAYTVKDFEAKKFVQQEEKIITGNVFSK